MLFSNGMPKQDNMYDITMMQVLSQIGSVKGMTQNVSFASSRPLVKLNTQMKVHTWKMARKFMLSSPSFKLLVLPWHASAGLSANISTHTGMLVLCASISLQVCCSSVTAISAHTKHELCKLYNACFMSKNVNLVTLMFSNIFTIISPPQCWIPLSIFHKFAVSFIWPLCKVKRGTWWHLSWHKWLLQALLKIHILKSFLQT